ncbi:MAG: aldehyde dehydrogenase family protein [Deltaproteobacteria bacterium]|nr:aldehyde dehydrogenase family protein [Deltaproteobacteria bacterium]MCX7952212.1 aldehyde dehydrogenase family protein [Deltaproteobacteria bacterium]
MSPTTSKFLPSCIPSEITKNIASESFHYIKTSPIDGSLVAEFFGASQDLVEKVCEQSAVAQKRWQQVPIPKRQALLIDLYDELLANRSSLVESIQLEVGKIREEAEGEIQEALDMILFCIGLTRTLEGKIFPSERMNHFMFERWLPVGVCGVITAFNFPVAVWAWNAMLAITCGNSVVWKPSELTPLTSYLVSVACDKVCKKHGFEGLLTTIFGGKETGSYLVRSDIPRLISATGSVNMGREVNKACADKFKKVILELGGNNAVIIHEDANLDQALKAVYFGIVGTAGQRCTSIRRLIIHASVFDEFLGKLADLLAKTTIGDPRLGETKMGPLISEEAAKKFEDAVSVCKSHAEIVSGGKRLELYGVRTYVQPTLVKVLEYFDLINHETFAPLVYLFRYSSLDEAISLNNRVPQGLSSAIFTNDLKTGFKFLENSDCGLANVNTSTSGAEIGLAFGGEKDTGGGREAGSDCWKFYMRRQSCVINWSGTLPLAQDIKFFD